MMRRTLAIAAVFALAMPTLAAAQEHYEEHHPPPHGPPPKPFVRPVPGPGPHGPGPGTFTYRGHPFNRVHLAPFVYPPGWAYRRWAVGAVLPPLFLVPAYFYANWAALGLPPPQPGYQWVRYGPDLLLVDVATGQVVDVVYGAFY